MISTPKGEPVQTVAMALAIVMNMSDDERNDFIARLDNAVCLECGWVRPPPSVDWIRRICHCRNDI